MRRTLSIWLAVVLAAMSVACSGCKIPTPVDEPTSQQDTTTVEPADLSLIKLTVPVTDDWVWSGKPQITINIDNPNAADVTVGTKIKITTDSKKDLETLTDSVSIPGKSSYEFVVTTTNNLDPGFYRAQCLVNGKTHKSFVFGIDPFKIVSLPDKQPDYDQFWQAAKEQLAAIDMNARLTEITAKSSATRKVYLVEMNSVPDGLEGEPVTIRGYYCEPQDGQPHPVIMHFYGYDTQGSKAKCECPSGGSSTNAEFYLSHRGQYLNNRPASTGNPGITEDCVNIYGDWFSYNFGDKDSWYYRGAYMDVVQAVRFMATRETSDMSKLFAEGSSQGGALTYACAALSDYPCSAIAANVAFLGDFADFIEIGGLAAETARRLMKKTGLTKEEMLQFLSYFDTKNLTTRISCAVLASSGLQDDVCPPRTNVVPFNNLATPESEKEYIFGPQMGHSYPGSWYTKMDRLFKSKM